MPHETAPLLQHDYEPGKLKRFAYSIEEVSNAIITHLRRDGDLTTIQISALERFKLWNQSNDTVFADTITKEHI